MEYIDCKSIAQKWKDEIKAHGIKAKFYVLQVGDDPASTAYINGKIKDAQEVGFECVHIHIPATTREQVYHEVSIKLEELKYSMEADGVILQLPLPFGLTMDDFKDHMNPDKDVDGFLTDSPFAPCTPDGIMQMLNEIGVSTEEALCVIAGRSNIVGKPMARLMTDANATVCLCHSFTDRKQLEELAKKADIFVSAVGKPNFISSNLFKKGAVVIDVGINRTENGLCGDIFIDKTNTKNILITPVPGGVGLLTRAMLMQHILRAYEKYHIWRAI